MDMFGTVQLKAPRERLWHAFHDSSLIKQCIPGCESFEWTEEDRCVATAAIAVGPIAATFKGELQLFDVEPPVTCTISGEANGGVKGFVMGVAKVRLDESPEGTELSYFAEARFCRRLTKFGSSRVDATAKELAARFFDSLCENVEVEVRKHLFSSPSSSRG
ncbi:carbon monoxide dehydrogenase subunit G [Bradyrhizobium sp. AZCC 1577]|uniref:CoxG family protein n=1 Tax=Bradyrhizobium sp. AZCC 1577 TaxID=3117019 RepID=UPI002FF0CC70